MDAGADTGFDVRSTIKRGTTVANTGFAVLSVGGRAGLYRVDLSTGDVAARGGFPVKVTDLAVDLDR